MNTSDIPEKDRALVLQGGGSLGAYEAGAYKALYYWLAKKDKEEGKKKSSTFNIIAGTSIGAMNAAVLTSYFVENNTYEGSAERLIEFWRYLSEQSLADTNPWFKIWWDSMHSINKAFATGEAARRYYSAREFSLMGVPNVFSPRIPIPDNKFLDLFGNTWYRFSNEPLKRSLEKFAKFPIATSFEDNQPRLILVAVDVADGLPVTFDSYPKADGSRKTEYGRYISQEGNEIGFERVINYDKGITSDHVMASGSYPVNFDYASLEVESYDPHRTNNRRQEDQAGTSQKDSVDRYSSYYIKKKRYFWDGGLMSNTPLSQLVLMHRNYWYQIKGVKEKVPTLGICIVNVHPTRQVQIPVDHDGVLNRNNDITFSDRSHRDEEILLLISDYIDLVKDLIKTGKENGVKDDIINELMNRQTKYHGQVMKPRNYKDIVEGSFDIAEVVRIERKNDQNTISDKTFDFSSGTIENLLQSGYDDTMDTINNWRTSNIPQ
ncbi:MAG TPA: patatin-like phospholipase family protein [Nitrososphaeraceae archaeon]|jgi:predicted acylesterase/phospholipase RssA